MVRVVMEKGWQAKLAPHVDEFLDDIAERVAKVARIRAPYRTGRLKANIRVHKIRADGGFSVISNMGRRIHAHVPYASAVELGTYRHIIRPRFKKALWWPGARHPMAMVRHPGATAHPFLRPALYRKIVTL